MKFGKKKAAQPHTPAPRKMTTAGTRQIERDNTDRKAATFFKVAIVAVPLSMLLSLFSVTYAVLSTPEKVDVPALTADTVEVQDWAAEYVRLWLSGTSPAVAPNDPNADRMTSEALKILRSRTSSSQIVMLPPTNFQVISVQAYAQPRFTPVINGQVWRVGVEVVATAPAAARPSRMFFSLDVAKRASTYKVVALPRPINALSESYEASTFMEPVRTDAAVYRAAEAFAEAYLVPSSKKNQFGGLVTDAFRERTNPLAGSPYSSVKVTSFVGTYEKGAADNPGSVVVGVLTVQANVTTSTYTQIQIPLRMVCLEGANWVVDSMTVDVPVSGLFTEEEFNDLTNTDAM